MSINQLAFLANIGNHLHSTGASMLLYLGSETIMPMASICGCSFLLIFWRFILKMIKKALSRI
jgi:hypothetical protein